MTEKKILKVDLATIRETACKGIRRAVVFLGLGVNAANNPNFREYELADISPIHLLPEKIGVETIQQFKVEFGRWVTGCGLRELIESFALFLDKTYNAALFFSVHKNKVPQAEANKMRAAFEKKGIEAKLQALKQFQIEPKFPEHLISIQRVRNCLTHRWGKVEAQDCNSSDELVLSWQGFDIFVETPTGKTIDLILPLKEEVLLPDGGTAMLRYSERTRCFKMGTVIQVEPRDLLEICNFVLISTDQIFKKTIECAIGLGVAIDNANVKTS